MIILYLFMLSFVIIVSMIIILNIARSIYDYFHKDIDNNNK